MYSSVFIMKNGLLPSLAGGSERPHADQYAVSTTAMGGHRCALHDPTIDTERERLPHVGILGSVRKCEL